MVRGSCGGAVGHLEGPVRLLLGALDAVGRLLDARDLLHLVVCACVCDG